MALDLYEIVEHYSKLGHHRTATPVERETIEWLSTLLSEEAADVSLHSYEFEKFEAEIVGTGSAEGVFLDALYYSAVGEFAVRDAHVARLEFDEDRVVGALALGLTQHVGVVRGLIQTKVRLGPWKARLQKDPHQVMNAYLECMQGRA